jgi:hypothetical protein
MSRFYNTSQSNPIDWAYQLPYQEMMQGVLSKQAIQDQGTLTLENIEAAGENIRHLSKDSDTARTQADWLNKNIDEFSNQDLTDRSNRSKLKSFSREAAKRWGSQGVVGAMGRSVDARDTYLKQLEENDKLTPHDRRVARDAYDKAYGGLGDDSPYGGTYSTYKGEMLSDSQDIPTIVRDVFAKIKPDIESNEWTEEMGMYFKDRTAYTSLTSIQKQEAVLEGILSSPAIRSYMEESLLFGRDPSITQESLTSPTYIEFLDGDGTTRKGLNPKSYKANLLHQGSNMLGSDIRSSSKIRNNSAANQRAGWQREDDLLVDNYTDLYALLKEKGSAELDGTTIKALFPDGKVSLSDAILFGGVGKLINKSPEDLELIKELSDLVSKDAQLSNREFNMGRFWSAAKNGFSFGGSKGWSPTVSESGDYDRAFKAYSAAHPEVSKEEILKRVEKVTKGLSENQIDALVTASFIFNSNIPVEIIGDQKAGAKIVGGSMYATVNTEMVPVNATGLTWGQLETINEQLGDAGSKPFTLIRDGQKEYVSIKMNVKHDFNEAASLNYNDKTGATHDGRTVENFRTSVDYFRRKEFQEGAEKENEQYKKDNPESKETPYVKVYNSKDPEDGYTYQVNHNFNK